MRIFSAPPIILSTVKLQSRLSFQFVASRRSSGPRSGASFKNISLSTRPTEPGSSSGLTNRFNLCLNIPISFFRAFVFACGAVGGQFLETLYCLSTNLTKLSVAEFSINGGTPDDFFQFVDLLDFRSTCHHPPEQFADWRIGHHRMAGQAERENVE